MANPNTNAAPNGATAKPKRKPQVRNNKPQVLFMGYKGDLTSEPTFHFDKEKLIDALLEDRDLKIKKIVVPKNTRPRTAPDAGNQSVG